MRKGQVTLFVIIGIILLIVSLLLAYVITSFSEVDENQGTFDTDNIEFMITDCIKKTGSDGLNLLGQNGNYIEVPELLKYQGTSYWIYKYANLEPVFNSSIDEYQEWFNKRFLNCLDFDTFPGYKFDYSTANSRIEYGADEVIYNVNFPINITKGKKVKTLEQFTVVSNIRYRRILEKARDIINAHYNPNFDYLNALKLVDKENFNIEYQIIDQDNLVFTITERDKIEYNDYVFKFATNLERSDLKRTAMIDANSFDFFMPYVIYSPDRMAVLTLNPGVKITGKNNVDVHNISVWAEYEEGVSREVTNQLTHTDGKKDSSSQTEINYVLDYPIYNFEPNETKFSPSQRLAIYWDNDKIPNQGLMGMLYRGERSDFQWRPIEAKANYEEHFMYSDIEGFSQYTVVDCARQECKSASVTGKSVPSSMCMGWATMIFVVLLIMALLAALLFAVVLAVAAIVGAVVGMIASSMAASVTAGVGLTATTTASAAAAAGATAAVTATASSAIAIVGTTIVGIAGGIAAGVIIDGAGFESGDTSVAFIPTCDQIVEGSCIGSSTLVKGDGTLGTDTIPKDSTTEVDGTGGSELMLMAMAKECKKDAWKCYKCEITCSAAYK